MSHGLGKMQQLIMRAIDKRRGGDLVCTVGGWQLRLSSGIHDMRIVCKELCPGRWCEGAWQASFSRAVRGLEKRGLLKFLWLVPIENVEDEYKGKGQVEYLSDGAYWRYDSRQRRFFIVADSERFPKSPNIEGRQAPSAHANANSGAAHTAEVLL